MLEQGSSKPPQASSARDLNRGLFQPARELNRGFSRAIDLHIRWHKVEGHTSATVETAHKRIMAFVSYLLDEGRPPDDLASVDRMDILTYLEHLKSSGMAPISIRTRLGTLKAFFNWAVEWDLLESNPAEKIRPPKVPKVRKGFLPPWGMQAILDLCPVSTFLGARRQAMVWVFATTGARHLEVTSIRLDDLDWSHQSIRIRMGKGQKERWVAFHAKAQLAITRYMAHRDDTWPELWVTEERRPLKYPNLGQDMKRMLDRAGIQVKDRTHIFRRTWAANAIRQGIPRQYVQAGGGWSTPHMLDHYTAAMQDEEQAVEAFRTFDPTGR